MLVKPLVNLVMLCMCGCVCRHWEERRDIPRRYVEVSRGPDVPCRSRLMTVTVVISRAMVDEEPGSLRLPALISGPKQVGPPRPPVAVAALCVISSKAALKDFNS